MNSRQRLTIYVLAIALLVSAAIALRQFDFIGTIKRLHG